MTDTSAEELLQSAPRSPTLSTPQFLLPLPLVEIPTFVRTSCETAPTTVPGWSTERNIACCELNTQQQFRDEGKPEGDDEEVWRARFRFATQDDGDRSRVVCVFRPSSGYRDTGDRQQHHSCTTAGRPYASHQVIFTTGT